MSSGKDYFRWTDDLKLQAARLASKNKAYLKTSDSMENKWTIILENFQSIWWKFQRDFRKSEGNLEFCLLLFPKGPKISFKDFRNIQRRTHLSGLPEGMTEYESLMVTLAEEKEKDGLIFIEYFNWINEKQLK